MRRLFAFFSVLGLLLASCGRDSGGVDTEPDVAITRISGPLLATQQAPESGGAGGGSVGTSYDPSELLKPGGGPITVAASSLFDPVSGQTEENPLSVYVVASDERNVETVQLFQNGSLIGARSKAEDGVMFKNPFIFPKPGSVRASVQLQGTPSGMLSTQLRAVATDSSGQTKESAPLTLQIDGSRPDLSVSVSGGDGAPYSSTELITLTGSASDPETGIESFDVTLNGTPIPVDASNSFTTSETLEAGSYTLLLTAVNGVSVPNQAISTFQVAEASSDGDGAGGGTGGGGSGGNPGNRAPTVSLLAAPLSGDAPLNVSFTASANDLDGDEVSYLYSFGDGETTAGAPAASHTYIEDGTYTATVTVADGKGGTASDSVEIVVGDGDNGNDNGDGNGGGGDDGDDGGNNGGGDDGGNGGGATALSITNFTASDTSVSSGDSVTLSWEISGSPTEVTLTPDGSVVTGNSKVVNPAQTTTYVLTAKNDGGTDTEELTVTVGDGGSGDDGGDDGGGDGGDDGDEDNGQAPAVSIDGDDPRSATVGEAQGLEASTSNLGDTVTYQWSVTDGDAAAVSFADATAEDTTVTFKAAGSYTLTLTARSDNGTVTDTLRVSVTDANNGGGGSDDGDGDNGGVDAKDDRKSTARNQAVTLDVLANDKPSVRALTIIAATAPRRGGKIEITRDSRNIVYTPPKGFTGTDTFKYTVTDGKDHTSRALVTIVVR